MARDPITFRADEDIIRRLDAIVEITGESRAEVIERAVSVGLAEIERTHALFKSPVVGSLLTAMLSNPSLWQRFLKAGGEEINDATAAELANRVSRIGSKKRGQGK